MSITLRNIKGSPLTHEEMDENFSALTSSLGAGDGLTGGGFLTTEVEFNVGQGDGITVNPDSIQVNATVARTGSNVFTDDQTISGSIYLTGSLIQDGVINLVPTDAPSPSSDPEAFIYSSGSEGDLYFRQTSSRGTNEVKLRWLEGNLYSGILSGGVVSGTPGGTTFSVGAGTGIIVDLNASTGSLDIYPIITEVEWDDFSNITPTYLNTNDTTWLLINSSGNLIQQTNPPTDEQFSSNITIGAVIHPNKTTINLFKTFPLTSYALAQQTYEFIRVFGPIKKSGHVISPGASSLTVSRSSGTAFALGRNYVNNPNEPSLISDDAKNEATIYRYYQSGSEFVTVPNNATIDPTNYNTPSTSTGLTSVAGGQYSIQRVFFFPDAPDILAVYYGREVYNSIASALENLDFEPFVEIDNTVQQAIFLGYIIVKGNTTDLSNTSDARFLQAGNFRSTVTSGGGGTPSTSELNDLEDVSLASLEVGDLLVYNGAEWQNRKDSLNITGSFSGSFEGTAIDVTSASFDRLDIGGDSTINGDLTVEGKVTAQEFHTEFVSASIIYQSGSTKFGDTLDDTHNFTGSVNITGSLTGIGTTALTGNVDLTGDLNVDGDITGSSNIDIAGTVDANVYSINGTTVVDSSRNITGSNGTFSGNVDVANLDSSGNVDANTFSINGSTIVDSSENITGASLDVTGEVEGNSFAINTSTVIDSSQNITGASLDVTGEVEGNTFAVDGTVIVDASRNFTGSNAEFTGDLLVEGNTTLGNADADRVDILGETIALSGSNITLQHDSPNGEFRIQTLGGTNNKLILSSSGDIEIEQSMTMKNLETSFQSVGYLSGFTGQGFDINFASQSSAEFDNLTVRGSMRVFELIINQIRATNGSLFVSSVGKVDSVVDLGTTDGQGRQEFALIFDTGSGDIGHGFVENDVIRAQRVNRNAIAEPGTTQSIDGNLVYRSDLTVTSVQDLKLVTASLSPGTTIPSSSFEFVRLGNTTNANRQGNVYLTSDDNYAPFIDVVDGITDHSDWNNSAVSGGVKVRVGKIDGVNSPEFGDLQGYGMWASGSVYLEGSINATAGLVGGWAIEPGYLESNNIKLQSSGSAGGELISIGATAGIASNGIFLSGSGEFNLQLDSDNRITQTGGTLDLRAENLVAKGDTVEISGSNFHLLNGNITASNVDLSGNINAETGTIGGFRITDSAITGSSFFLSGSATGNEFFISSSKFNVKANGDVTGSQVLFTGGKITGSAILFDVNDFTAKGDNVEISGSNFHLLNGNITASNVDLSGNINAQTGTIGGFTITDSAIIGSSFFLSGSATGNEFFISASNFNVKANGDLTASNANITGDIVANNITATTAGNIAGWSIGSSTLSSGDVYLSNDTNEKGLYISSSVNRLQVGEFDDYVPSPTTLGTGTRTETTSADSKIDGYLSLDGFFLTNETGSATDTASIFVPIIGTINQNDTVIVTQPVEFIGYSDRANLGFTYDSFTDSVTVEIVSGSSNTVVASSEAFLRPTPSNPNLPGASKTVQVSFFYTGSQALTSTGDLKAKITNTVDYNRTVNTGTFSRLVDINGLVVKKDTAVVNITNNQAFFYAGENRQFKWTPDELIFKGGELDITDLVVENVFVTSSNTNVIAVQAEDANQDGLLWGIAANGDPYFAPISKSFYDFNSELRYDQSEERWQFDDELYVNGVLNGTTATFTGDLNAGDISGSTLESSGNTVVKGNLTVIGDTIISGSIDGHPVISPVASDSDSNTNGVVIQNLTVDAFGHLENIGTVDLDNRFVEKAGDTMTGNLILTDKLLSSQNNTDVDTGTEVIATVATATYDAAFFDFVIKKTTNLRAGTVYAIHDGTNVEFTETSTQDLGDTSDVTLSVDISGGNLRLNATTTSNDWSVKALVRGL